MQIDLDVVAEPTQFYSSVCILGAGVAGLLLARNLSSHGIDVNIIEAGGHSLENRSQDIYNVDMEGIHHHGATEGRFRMFGGSSTRWGGQLLPYTPDIFSPSADLLSEGWPLASSDLEPYYAEVQNIMHVCSRIPDAEMLAPLGMGHLLGDADVNVRFSKWAPFSKRNLAHTIGRECIESDRITIFLHANATAIEINKATGRVELIVAKSYSGRGYQFSAKHFVVCMGTIESCRLLLASKTVFAEGIGNTTDNVGRYFHDHLSVAAAEVKGNVRRQFVRLFAPIILENTLHTPKLEASVSLRRQHRLLAVMAHFAIEEPEGSGFAAIRGLLQSIQRREGIAPSLKALIAVPRNSAEIVKLLWYARLLKRRAISTHASITLRLDSEQLAKAESRVKLSAQADALGMPRALVDWRISEEERRTVQIYAKAVERFLNQIGLGPLTWRPEVSETQDSWSKVARDTYHPMGGTRMGVDPSRSVVNSDLQVHGIANLFIASCSVFPSGGSSNPTFTLMALTLRLGAHLASL